MVRSLVEGLLRHSLDLGELLDGLVRFSRGLRELDLSFALRGER
jgi:hypothetical protein